MSLFDSILEKALNIVALPVDVVKDSIDVIAKKKSPSNISDRIAKILENDE